HPARQYAVEMRHQLDVVGIMSSDVGQSVRKRLTSREMALEAGPSAIQRVSAGVNDPCSGQDQMNEPDIAEISQALIGKKWPLSRAMLRHHGEIVIGQCARFAHRTCFDKRGKSFDQARPEFEPAADPEVRLGAADVEAGESSSHRCIKLGPFAQSLNCAVT